MKRINVQQNTEAWFNARRGKLLGSSVKDVIPSLSAGKCTKDDIIEVLQKRDVPFKKSAKKEELEELLTVEDEATIKALSESRMFESAVSGEKKSGFYKLVAEMMGIYEDDDDYSDIDRRERGQVLEPEAIQAVEQHLGKIIEEQGIWISDECDVLGISPDGVIKDSKDTEAVEIKCFKAWKHIRAILENKVPDYADCNYIAQRNKYFIVNEKLQTLYFCFYNPLCKFKPLHVIIVKREDIHEEIEQQRTLELLMVKEAQATVNKLLGF